MNGKGSQTCEVIKESGREGFEIVFIQGGRGIMREGLGKGRDRKRERYEREERPVNKSE